MENFWVIIAVQFCWFLTVTAWYGNIRKVIKFILFGGILGIPYGFAMDAIIGHHHEIFAYGSLGQSESFLFLNALFSYGLAISTTFNLNYLVGKGGLHSNRQAFYLTIVAVAVIVAKNKFGVDGILLSMFIFGIAIISFTEAMFIFSSGRGLLIDIFTGRVRVAWLFLFCFLTGSIYETANLFFPLWEWQNDFPSVTGNTILIAALGYFVLIYPMLFISYTFQSLFAPRLA